MRRKSMPRPVWLLATVMELEESREKSTEQDRTSRCLARNESRLGRVQKPIKENGG